MAQGVLPFQYKAQRSQSGLTALAGLPAYLDLAQAAGLSSAIRRHLQIRGQGSQGWSDHQMVMALILRWSPLYCKGFHLMLTSRWRLQP
jgi:hypothetical protein